MRGPLLEVWSRSHRLVNGVRWAVASSLRTRCYSGPLTLAAKPRAVNVMATPALSRLACLQHPWAPRAGPPNDISCGSCVTCFFLEHPCQNSPNTLDDYALITKCTDRALIVWPASSRFPPS